MSSSPSQSEIVIGYYTVEYSDSIGWTGGLLILNATGRPLEFHCTLPVRPTRAHEILFGKTLRSHLVGELIGPALLKQAKAKMSLICVDHPEGLLVRHQCDTPILCTTDPHNEDSFSGKPRDATDFDGISHLEAIPASGFGNLYCLGCDRVLLEGLLRRSSELPDFLEPFQRIREAVREAQMGPAASRVA